MRKEYYSDTLEREDNFIKLYKFTCQLPPTESYMLSYLIDAEKFVKNRYPQDESYFMCDKKDFIGKFLTGWPKDTIKQSIKRLQAKGLIDTFTKNIGFRNHTWIKLNYDQIDELKQEWQNSLAKNSDDFLDSDLDNPLGSDFNDSLSSDLNDSPHNKELYNKEQIIKNYINIQDFSNPCSNINQSNLNITSKNIDSIDKGNNTIIDMPAPARETKTISDTSKNLKDVFSMIRQTENMPSSVKDELIKFYKNCSRKYTIAQIKDNVNRLYTECNGDWDLFNTSVTNSYMNGWNNIYIAAKTKVNDKKKSTKDLSISKPVDPNNICKEKF